MDKKKVALLSNINMNFTVRLLQDKIDTYENEGYGNELGVLLERNSSLYEYNPQIIFMITDLNELVNHEQHLKRAQEKICQWFSLFESSLDANRIYFVGDGFCRRGSYDLAIANRVLWEYEQLWNRELRGLCNQYPNVYWLDYANLIISTGEENAFCAKTWYMGKIIHSTEIQNRLAQMIIEKINMLDRVPKKLLVLDLDNTLWGGLAGEADNQQLALSDDGLGLAYKDLQRVIRSMKDRGGVALAIVSKNNEEDAIQVINHHPHMVLRMEDFVAHRINWKNKDSNIREIAEELNIGLDSVVYFDDQPSERQLVKMMLPQVEVPEFPKLPDQLPATMFNIFKKYFQQLKLTSEDINKTEQYHANSQRQNLRRQVHDFESYLKMLEMVTHRENAKEHSDRVLQLINKTNQFNLTGYRLDSIQMQNIFSDKDKSVFCYRVKDRYGDNGIVSVVIVDLSDQIPCIFVFVMSCRVMGKYIENFILDDVETTMSEKGYTYLKGIYRKTSRNKPVADLYSRLGYEKIQCDDTEEVYQIKLRSRPRREYYLEVM